VRINLFHRVSKAVFFHWSAADLAALVHLFNRFPAVTQTPSDTLALGYPRRSLNDPTMDVSPNVCLPTAEFD
jgi:hypothetical protein